MEMTKEIIIQSFDKILNNNSTDPYLPFKIELLNRLFTLSDYCTKKTIIFNLKDDVILASTIEMINTVDKDIRDLELDFNIVISSKKSADAFIDKVTFPFRILLPNERFIYLNKTQNNFIMIDRNNVLIIDRSELVTLLYLHKDSLNNGNYQHHIDDFIKVSDLSIID